MQLIVQPNRWSCLPTSFAMALDCKVDELIEEIGHDGSEIIYPDASEPLNRRSFHTQELIDCAIKRFHAVVPIEIIPVSCNDVKGELYDVKFQEGNEIRIMKYLNRFDGVIVGRGIRSGLPHAVAWDSIDCAIKDPVGRCYRIDDFAVEIFFAIIPF